MLLTSTRTCNTRSQAALANKRESELHVEWRCGIAPVNQVGGLQIGPRVHALGCAARQPLKHVTGEDANDRRVNAGFKYAWRQRNE